MNPRYRSLASMGTASKRSLIKRINQRIVSIAKRFGTDSETYKSMIASLDNEKYSKYIGKSNVSDIGFSKKGRESYLKLNVNLARDKDDPVLYDLLLTSQGAVTTIGEITKRAKARLEERGLKATREAIDEEVEKNKYYDNELSKVKEFIYATMTDAEAQERYPELYRGQDGSRPDYDILDDIIARDKEEREKWAKDHNI